jgi:hypothetical protein
VGLPWVRLDCAFPRNPKILALLEEKDGYRAAFAYTCMLSYSGEQGTDGFIPRAALPFVHARVTDVTRLVTHGFVYPQPGGWLIHGWAEFQESNEETQKRRIRAQAGAAARWNGHEPMTHADRQKRYRERHEPSLCDGAPSNAAAS